MDLKSLIDEIKLKPNKRRIKQIQNELDVQYNENRDCLENNYLQAIFYSELSDNKEQADKYFEYLIDNDCSYVHPYIYMARKCRDNKLKSKKILKRGLVATNNNIKIIEEMLFQASFKEKYEIYFENIKNKYEEKLEEHFLIYIIDILFGHKKYNDLIETFDKFDLDNKFKNKNILPIIYLVKSISYYKCEDYINAKNALEKIENYYINKTIDTFLYTYKSLLKFCLEEDDYINVLDEINYVDMESTEYINFDYDYFSPISFNFDDIFMEVLDTLETIITNKEDLFIKISIIEIIFKLEIGIIEEKEIKEIPRFIKILELALEKENNCILITTIFSLYILNKNYYKAMEIFLDNNPNSEKWDIYFFFIDITKCTEQQIGKLRKKMKNIHFYNEKNLERILKIFVNYYEEKEKYFEIINIVEELLLKQNLKIPNSILFEVAYAYNEEKNFEKAKIYYEEYINNNVSAPALNNLSLIYENENDIDKAIQLLEKANDLYSNNSGYSEEQVKRCKRNLSRCKKKKEDKTRLEKEMQDAQEQILSEGYWYIDKLDQVYERQDELGYIIMSQNDLITILHVRPDKAKEFVDKAVNKGYLIRVKEHNFDTLKSVYKVNKYVEQEIKKYNEQNTIFNTILNNIAQINEQTITNTSYIEMLSNINNIQDAELKEILKRDLKENLVAYLTNSYKTCLILSGSMIENILLDRVMSNGIVTYQIDKKNVKVNKMDLSQLIFVAETERLIDKIPLDLANAIRGFRNFIHPGKEYRSKDIMINEVSAGLAWSALKYIILGHL